MRATTSIRWIVLGCLLLGVTAAGAGVNEWTRLGSGLTGVVNLVRSQPGQPSRLLAGTEDGLFLSDNGGATWRLLGLAGRSVMALVVDPRNPVRLYAGTNNGAFVSGDNGFTWSRGAGLEVSVFSVLKGQSPDSLVYAGTFGRGVFTSADDGRTWRVGNDSLANDIVFSLATSALEPGAIYAGTGRGLFVSRDGGRGWSALGSDLRGRSVRAVHLPSRSEDAGRITVATFGQGVLVSLDRGVTWQSRNDGLSDLAVRALAVDDDLADLCYVATSTAGFFRSTDGGRSWQALNQGLPSLTARQVTLLPDDARTVVGVGPGNGVWEIRLDPEPQLVVSREPLDFGSATVGGARSLVLQVANGGNATLVVSSLTVEGSSGFAVTPGRLTVAPGGRDSVEVRFTPVSRGIKQAVLALASDDRDEPRVELVLRGTGVQGELVAQPVRVRFGEVRVGSYRDTSVVVTNSGNAAVTLANAYCSDTAFRVPSFQSRTLQPGQRAVVPVRFVPLAARGVTGRLTVTQADQSAVLLVELDGVGTAPDLSVSPTALDFGTVDPGRQQTLTLYLTNSGNAPLSVRDLQISGEGFWVGQAVPLVVPAGQVVPLEVAFLPLSSGSFTGTLRVLSDAPGRLGAWEVPLIGVGGGLTLVPRPTVTVAAGAADLLLADWNGDGYPDLAVADSSAGQVKVLLCDGAGGFSSISAYPGPSSVYGRWDGPVALAAAPILSSYPDLIVADRVGRSISILENDGSGRFDHRRSDLYIGYAVADVLTADLDADGDEDIVIANGDTTTLTLLFNDGRGAFNARATRSVESGPVALAAANLNADGYPDLVVANRRSGTVSVLLNDRGGGFQARQDLLSGLDPVALALVDFDADGDNDILAANQGSWDVAVLANEEVLGETGFRLVHRVRAGMPVADLALSDLTADIFSDLVTVGSGSAQVAFLENEAGSGFVPRDTLVTGEPARRVALADVNADGANDLAILGATDLRLFLNLDARRLDPPRPPTRVTAQDVARDLGRQIEVAWAAPELDEQLGRTTEYVVSRARSHLGPYTPIDTVEAGWRSTIDATATLADTFYYYVTAGNAALRSAPSDTVWAVSRPAPFFELQLVDEPRISVGDTLKVRAFVTPADHRIAGLSLYLTFEDSALALILPDSAFGRRPFRVATQLSGATVLQNQLHPRSLNRIDLSLANLHLDPGVEPVLLGEVWFSTARDTVAFIKIDDQPGENRSSAVVEDVTGEYLLPFIPKEPLQVAARDYQVRGQVQLLGRGSAALPSSFSLFLVTATGDTLRSPLNDADRLKPGIQGALDAEGQFRLDQIPRGRYQVLAKAPTHLQGRIVGDTVTVGEATRTQLAFRWVGSDSVSHESLPAGDANDDNQINLADFGVLVRYYGQTTMNQATWSRAQAADFDGDGRVTTDDLFLLADYFGEVGMALGRAARSAGVSGELSDDGQTVAVRGAGLLTGFSVRIAGTDSVRVSLAGSVWEDRELLVWQWPEGEGRRVVAALRDPRAPVDGEGVLVHLVPTAGAPSLQVTAAELLDVAQSVLPVILSGQVPLPASPGLLPNYPNPFNPATTIPFVVNAQGRGPVEVRLTIYNALGQRVRTLYDGGLPPGWHRTVWDGLDDQGLAAGTGVYLCRLEVGSFRQTRRLLMIH